MEILIPLQFMRNYWMIYHYALFYIYNCNINVKCFCLHVFFIEEFSKKLIC